MEIPKTIIERLDGLHIGAYINIQKSERNSWATKASQLMKKSAKRFTIRKHKDSETYGVWRKK